MHFSIEDSSVMTELHTITNVSLSSQVVFQSKEDQVTVVGAGVTLHEALAAAEQLKKGKGGSGRVSACRRCTVTYLEIAKICSHYRSIVSNVFFNVFQRGSISG